MAAARVAAAMGSLHAAAPGEPFTWAGGIFQQMYRNALGQPPNLYELHPEQFGTALLEQARATWCERVVSEFRSIQIMTRFLGELVSSGEPVDVYAGALDLVKDEVRHTELCAAVCERLGATPRLPNPVELRETAAFNASPPRDRALVSAISMLCINETLSVSFIEDLATRCTNPGLRAVLHDIIGDEEEHQEFGWSYVRRALLRQSDERLRALRGLVRVTLAPHEQSAARALSGIPDAQQRLALLPEPDLAALGLFSPVRQALVYRRCVQEVLLPKLAAMDLTPRP